jgi:hypothetical protein
MNDDEVMLMALSKEREQLHGQLMQVDRIIKKIKSGEYMGYSNAVTLQIAAKEPTVSQRIAFPKTTDTKVLVLRAFDNLCQVASLRQVQEEYNKISGNTQNIRETMRSLNKAKLVLMMKAKNADRGMFWVKKEWLNNGAVLDEYKPEGFDILYKSDDLLFI